MTVTTDAEKVQPLQERPFSKTQLFCSNLPWSVNGKMLREAFEEHGEVVDAFVAYNGRNSRGFGYVAFKEASAAAAACAQMNGVSLGDGERRMEIRVEMARERPPRGERSAPSEDRGRGRGSGERSTPRETPRENGGESRRSDGRGSGAGGRGRGRGDSDGDSRRGRSRGGGRGGRGSGEREEAAQRSADSVTPAMAEMSVSAPTNAIDDSSES